MRSGRNDTIPPAADAIEPVLSQMRFFVNVMGTKMHPIYGLWEYMFVYPRHSGGEEIFRQ